jgi:hypothetical protein
LSRQSREANLPNTYNQDGATRLEPSYKKNVKPGEGRTGRHKKLLEQERSRLFCKPKEDISTKEYIRRPKMVVSGNSPDGERQVRGQSHFQ